MNKFLINIIVALIWSSITGSFTLGNLLIGFALGYIILLVTQPIFNKSDYALNFWRALGLALYFLKELVMSSIIVAISVLKPKLDMESGVVAIPLEEAETDVEITMLANMITITPGTLSLEISDDHRTLYVHSMYIDPDVEAVREDIKGGFEKQILKLVQHIF